MLGSALPLLATAVVGVGVTWGADPGLSTACANFVGNIAANLGTDFLGRLHKIWRERSSATDENHVIIRTLRAAQLQALHDVAERFDQLWRSDQEPGRAPEADRFARLLRTWLDAERGRASTLIVGDAEAGDETTLAQLQRAIVARLPDDFSATLALRHDRRLARRGLGAAAEGAVLAELCAVLPWDRSDLPPMFIQAFSGGRDGADGWCALFIREAARAVRAGGEFTRIWTAEQVAVTRLLAEQAGLHIAHIEQLANDAIRALGELGLTLDAVAGDVAALLGYAASSDRLLRADQDLPLDLKSGLATDGWRRFAAHNPAIPFKGREAELALLWGFLDDQRPFAWWLVTGAGGSGKTRLALELCLRAHVMGWRCGFLRRFDPHEAWSLSLAWRPAAPTLIIADYASEQVARLSSLAERLHHQVDPAGSPVRLLLLERQADEVFEQRFVGSTASGSGAIAPHRYAKAVLAMPELGEDELWDLVRHCPWLPDARVGLSREAFFVRLRELDAKRRPLVAMILAEAASATPQRADFGSLEDELQALIRRDRKHVWPASLGAAGKAIGAGGADAVLAFATMADGLGEAQLAACAEYCPAVRDPDFLADCARAIGCPWDASAPRLERIEPDLIGEYFALETVSRGVGSLAQHAWLPDTAWRASESAMAAFVTHAGQNFPHHAALRRVEITVPGSIESWWLEALRAARASDSLDVAIVAMRDRLLPRAEHDEGAVGALGRLTEFASGADAGLVASRLRYGLIDLLMAQLPSHPDDASLRRAAAASLFNTLTDAKSEDGLSRRDALLEELRALAGRAPDDAAMREPLARGLFNTLNDAKAEDDLSRRDALLEELRALAVRAPDDAAVRLRLAMGLVNTLTDAKAEDDLSRRDALLEELRALAVRAPDDAAVRLRLAMGLFNTLNDAKAEDDLSRRDALLEELRALAGLAPDDAAVREPLARGLFSTLYDAKAEDDLSRRDALLEELRALAGRAPDDTAVREQLARGLFNTLHHAKAEDDLSRRDALLEELRALAGLAPDDTAVREQLARGLVNTLHHAKAEDDLSRRDALLDELRALAGRAPDDTAVREQLAMGLVNTLHHAKAEDDLSRRDALLEELRALAGRAPDDVAVREQLAMGLFNTLNDAKAEDDLSRRDALLEELRALAGRSPDDAAVRLRLAMGLFNTLNHAKAEDDLSRRDALLEELRALAGRSPDDAAVREPLAMGLFNTLNHAKAEDDLSRRDVLLEELRALAVRSPDDAAVRPLLALAFALVREQALEEGAVRVAGALIAELRDLAACHPEDSDVAEVLRMAEGRQ